MARPRKRIPLEDGLKLDLNKLRLQAISLGETIQQVILWDPGYSGKAGTIGLLIFRLASATCGVQWYFRCPMTGLRASVLWMREQ